MRARPPPPKQAKEPPHSVISDELGADKVRQRILDAAVDSFARSGFAGTSLRTVAKAAGVSFQMIAYYVGSKDDLWLAAYHQLIDQHRRRAQQKFSHSNNFEQQLRPWVRDALHLARDEPQLERMVMHESLAESPRYHKHVAARAASANRDFMKLYERAPEMGTQTPLSPIEMLVVLRGFINQLALKPKTLSDALGRSVAEDATMDYLVDVVIAIFLRGASTSHPSAKHQVPTAQL